MDLLSVFQNTADEFALKGHDITEASQGEQGGHQCSRCLIFHAKHKFNNWLIGKPCRPRATGKERQRAFEENFARKAKEARIEREALVIIESDEENERKPEPTKVQPEMKKATEADEAEADEVNEELRSGFKPKVKSQTGGEQTEKSEKNLNGKSKGQECAGKVCG